MKKTVAIIFIILCFIQNIYSSDLAIISLDQASENELAMMCSLRNLDCGDSKSEMISALKEILEAEGSSATTLEKDNNTEKENDETFSFEIRSANSMKRLSSSNNLTILNGDVVLVFKENDEEKTLSAQTIIVDMDNSKLAAMGDVSFSIGEDEESLFTQDISGEIITYNWTTTILQVTNASVFTERENSDEESVEFNATSALMTLNTENNSLILNDGFITTNPTNAYSSISADKIALLEHGDLYLEDAVVSLGRVDVLYLPYFFSPGATMIGNPSIGYDSTRGTFVNTTFELLGKYPNFESSSSSSFTSLLKTDDSEDNYATGSIYNSEEPTSKLQQWAMDTNSYFTLMLDAYEYTPYSIEDDDSGSVVLGYVSQANLFNNALTITSSAITSIASDGIVGDIESYDYYPVFRYDASLSAKYQFEDGSINLYMPVVSDPSVRKTYGNRLSDFSIDAIWNEQSFPSTYSSDIDSYSWTMDSKFNLSPDFLFPYIKNIKVSSFDSNIDYEWEKNDGSYSYVIDEMTLGDLDVDINGQLFTTLDENEEETEKENKDELDEKTQELLDNLYQSSKKNSSTDKASSYYDLSYNLNEIFYYTEDDDDDTELYNKSYLTLTSDGQIEPNILEVDNSTTFNFIYDNVFDDSESTSIDIKTKNAIQLPFINLSYYFDTRLYKYSITEEDGDIDEDIYEFEFSDDYITTHEIEWEKSFYFYDLMITPSVSLELPPLTLSIEPSLTLNYKNIQNKTVFTFDIDYPDVEFTEVENYIDYSINDLYFGIDIYYDIEDSKTANRLVDSLILTSTVTYKNKDKNQYFTHSSKYYGLYDDSEEDYFSDFSFSYKNKYLESKLNFYSESSQLELDYFKNTISMEDYTKYWWKNRIGLNLDLDATFNYSFSDIYSTYLSITGSLSLEIAEFLSLDFSITTSNYGFYNYYDDDDNFDFGLLFTDLANSLDIFGDGIYSTQFNLEEVSLDMVHMMEDWDLHCKYSGSVVLSNYNYEWVTSVSFYLQWNTLPELKVDESFTDEGDGWSYDS
jgi:hypothetical protein